jgi:hypothetical protein
MLLYYTLYSDVLSMGNERRVEVIRMVAKKESESDKSWW